MRNDESTEREELIRAFRAAGRVEGNRFFAEHDVIEFGDLSRLNGQALLQKVAKITAGVDYLQYILRGDFPTTGGFEGGATFTLTKGTIEERKNLLRESEGDLKRGINILERWRRVYNSHLRPLKARQPKTRLIPQRIKELQRRKTELITQSTEQSKKMQEKIRVIEDEINKLQSQFYNDNIDPTNAQAV